MKIRAIFTNLLREAGIGLALILLIVVFLVISPVFGTGENIRNILTQITINTIISVGMTFVILVGGIDLSVGSVIALCGVVAGYVLVSPLPVWEAIVLAIVTSLGIGTIAGLANGWVSERWKIPSFITTLGMMNVARGAALQISKAETIYNFPRSFNDFASTQVFGMIPLIFIIALVIVFMGRFILKRTVFGRLVYCIGNNEEAVRLSGQVTSTYKIITFVISGFGVGIASVIYMARLTMANAIVGTGFELNAIAAVIIGGTSFTGGKGSLMGTLLGACLMGVLTNGLILMGATDFIRQMITGAVIVVAVIVDTYRAKASLATQ